MAAELNGKAGKALAGLKELARIAGVLVDGDEAGRIIAERSLKYIADPNPVTRRMAGDYFDVDHATFLRMKKLLRRLERLVDFPCCVALWVLVKGQDNLATLAVQDGNVHRYWQWAAQRLELEGEVAECVKTGSVTTAPAEASEDMLTALAPVRDSLGDVVALVEFTAKNPASKKLDPAWS